MRCDKNLLSCGNTFAKNVLSRVLSIKFSTIVNYTQGINDEIIRWGQCLISWPSVPIILRFFFLCTDFWAKCSKLKPHKKSCFNMATTVFIAEIWSLSLPDAHPLRNDTTSQKTQDHLRSNTVGSTRARTSLILAWHNILFNTQPKITWSTWLALSWLQQSWAFSYWSCLLVPWLCNSEALPPVAICFRSLWSSKKVFISASG